MISQPPTPMDAALAGDALLTHENGQSSSLICPRWAVPLLASRPRIAKRNYSRPGIADIGQRALYVE